MSDLAALAEREGYPGEDGPHCRICELPRPVCACADARAYDRWWETKGKFEFVKGEPQP